LPWARSESGRRKPRRDGHGDASIPQTAAMSRSTAAQPGSTLLEARHQLDEVAGTETAVELGSKDTVPRILHRAGRTRQREDIGAARHARASPRLDGGRTNRLVAQPAEQFAKARDFLVPDPRQ